jgi:hypothetical protein
MKHEGFTAKLQQVSILRSIALFALGAGLASAQQYVAVDLTPTFANSMANAVSAGAAAGSIMVGTVQHGAGFSGGAVSDIHPQGWAMSVATGLSGSQTVGLGLPTASSDASAGSHAILWPAPSAGFVDLNPNGYTGSAAYCTTGTEQGGYAIVKSSGGGKVKTTPPAHAMLWAGSAAGYTDLNPPNTAESRLWGCTAGQQVGFIMPVSPGFTHAALWSGTSASAVDLQPQTGFVSSIAFSTAGGQQAGYGVTVPTAGGAGHALLWFGSAGSVNDLHPAGYTFSVAYATNGVQQVGEADDSALPRHKHAVVWSGSAGTVIDLNQFLPAGYTDAQAMAIDAGGNIAGYANNHAFLWMPVR